MVSSILIFVLVFYKYNSLNSRGYKIKLKTTLYTTVSIDIGAYYWDTQGVATFFFMVSNARGTGTWTNVKFPPTRDLIRVKCPGVAGGDGHSWIWLIHNSNKTHTVVVNFLNRKIFSKQPVHNSGKRRFQYLTLQARSWVSLKGVRRHKMFRAK